MEKDNVPIMLKAKGQARNKIDVNISGKYASSTRVYDNDSTNGTHTNESRKRKATSNYSTGISTKSILDLTSMVEKSKNYMKFLSECGKLTPNRNSIITEEIESLISIIKHKKSMMSHDCDQDNNYDNGMNCNRVSKINNKYHFYLL